MAKTIRKEKLLSCLLTSAGMTILLWDFHITRPPKACMKQTVKPHHYSNISRRSRIMGSLLQVSIMANSPPIPPAVNGKARSSRESLI